MWNLEGRHILSMSQNLPNTGNAPSRNLSNRRLFGNMRSQFAYCMFVWLAADCRHPQKVFVYITWSYQRVIPTGNVFERIMFRHIFTCTVYSKLRTGHRSSVSVFICSCAAVLIQSLWSISVPDELATEWSFIIFRCKSNSKYQTVEIGNTTTWNIFSGPDGNWVVHHRKSSPSPYQTAVLFHCKLKEENNVEMWRAHWSTFVYRHVDAHTRSDNGQYLFCRPKNTTQRIFIYLTFVATATIMLWVNLKLMTSLPAELMFAKSRVGNFIAIIVVFSVAEHLLKWRHAPSQESLSPAEIYSNLFALSAIQRPFSTVNTKTFWFCPSSAEMCGLTPSP